MNKNSLFQPHFIQLDLKYDPSWKLTGEIENGRPVCRETLPNLKLVPVVIDGEEQYWRHPTSGRAMYQIKQWVQDEKTPWITRDFIQVNLGNGLAFKNYDFRSSADDIRRRERGEVDPVDEMQARIAQLEEIIRGIQAAGGNAAVLEPVVQLPAQEAPRQPEPEAVIDPKPSSLEDALVGAGASSEPAQRAAARKATR